jgi:hypothetical protein
MPLKNVKPAALANKVAAARLPLVMPVVVRDRKTEFYALLMVVALVVARM